MMKVSDCVIQLFVFHESNMPCLSSGDTIYRKSENYSKTTNPLGEAYGIRTDILTTQDNLADELRRGLNTSGPVICDAHIVLDEIRQPRLSSTRRPDGSFVAKPLEDLCPFLGREEFLENMIVAPLPK